MHGNAHLLMEENALDSFYRHYYSEQGNKLAYPLEADSYTMMDLLSTNEAIKMEARRIQSDNSGMLLYQSFQKAAEAYRVIEGLSTPVIVNKGEGAQIIEKLTELTHPHSQEEWRDVRKLLRDAMKYTLSLNCSDQEVHSMLADGVLVLLPTDYPVYMLSEIHYDEKTGFSWSGKEPYAKNSGALIS